MRRNLITMLSGDVEKVGTMICSANYQPLPIAIAEQEDDGEPFGEKMKRLTSELSGLFAESHRLEDEIKKQLGSIGFEIE